MISVSGVRVIRNDFEGINLPGDSSFLFRLVVNFRYLNEKKKIVVALAFKEDYLDEFVKANHFRERSDFLNMAVEGY